MSPHSVAPVFLTANVYSQCEYVNPRFGGGPLVGETAGRMKKLTSTSYAVLGLLAIRPATAYELARQVTRSLNFIWPRAEGRIYDEPKLLVQHGLASGTEQFTGKRPSTRYTITAKGRRELRKWLAEPGAVVVLEYEMLLKVTFAEHATKAVLIGNLEAVRDQAATNLASGRSLADQLLEGDVPFPERLPVNALMWNFLRMVHESMLRWAEEALAEVEGWPDDLVPTPDMIERAYERFRSG